MSYVLFLNVTALKCLEHYARSIKGEKHKGKGDWYSIQWSRRVSRG